MELGGSVYIGCPVCLARIGREASVVGGESQVHCVRLPGQSVVDSRVEMVDPVSCSASVSPGDHLPNYKDSPRDCLGNTSPFLLHDPSLGEVGLGCPSPEPLLITAIFVLRPS